MAVEHEEPFTDDDETVGNDPEETEDNAPEIPAPPEIKQALTSPSPKPIKKPSPWEKYLHDLISQLQQTNEEFRDELKQAKQQIRQLEQQITNQENQMAHIITKQVNQEEEDEEVEQEDGQQEKGGVSESSGDEESSDDDNDLDNEDNSSPVLSPKRKEGPKEEPVESTPAKAVNAAPGRTTPASTAASKGKRKAGTDDSKPSPVTSSKKVKTESSQEDAKPAKEPAASASNTKGAGSPVKGNGAPPRAKSCSQVTEDDVKAVLKQAGPIKVYDLVNKFKSRLATKEDKQAFAVVLKNISRIHKTAAGKFIVLSEK